jgi:hypothetical protein
MFADTFKDHNVYVAPNPTNSTRGDRHSARDVTHWSYFLIDADPVCVCPKPRSLVRDEWCVTCRGEAEPDRFLREALFLLYQWFNMESGGSQIVISSGRGYQGWLRLEDVRLEDDASLAPQGRICDLGNGLMVSRSTARRACGHWLRKLDDAIGIRHGCRIDTSVSDLPRVMRLPGSFNVKTNRMAYIAFAGTEPNVGLARKLVDGAPFGIYIEPDPPEGLEPGQPWQMVYAHLTLAAQDYLKFGQEEPGRHKVMWHTAKKFHELGVSRHEARKALKWANALKGEDEELPPEQVEHALDTAYGTA